MEKQLLEYVEQESKRGVAAPMIKKALADAGWDSVSVEEAFAALQSRQAPPLPYPPATAGNEDVLGIENSAPGVSVSSNPNQKPIFIVSFVVMVAVLFAIAVLWFFSSRPAQDRLSSLSDGGGSATVPGADEGVNPPSGNSPETLNVSDNGASGGAAGTSTAETAVPATSGAAATSTVAGEAAATSTAALTEEAAARDKQRMNDMEILANAQKSWYSANNNYYTCGLAGGDCKGKPYGYPAQIGDLVRAPRDPLASLNPVCGKDYVYCGLNNAPYPHFFCYYAKLEAGGYYTASHAGNFKRSTPPRIFEECAAAN